ncbi:hypothetical protein BD779DRAFT_1538270, partial [Infundibulicybe gibba]
MIKGQQVIFLIGAGIAVLSTVMLRVLIPDREKQLESEEALFRKYLEDNGWDTSDMGMPQVSSGEKREKVGG